MDKPVTTERCPCCTGTGYDCNDSDCADCNGTGKIKREHLFQIMPSLRPKTKTTEDNIERVPIDYVRRSGKKLWKEVRHVDRKSRDVYSPEGKKRNKAVAKPRAKGK